MSVLLGSTCFQEDSGGISNGDTGNDIFDSHSMPALIDPFLVLRSRDGDGELSINMLDLTPLLPSKDYLSNELATIYGEQVLNMHTIISEFDRTLENVRKTFIGLKSLPLDQTEMYIRKNEDVLQGCVQLIDLLFNQIPAYISGDTSYINQTLSALKADLNNILSNTIPENFVIKSERIGAGLTGVVYRFNLPNRFGEIRDAVVKIYNQSTDAIDHIVSRLELINHESLVLRKLRDAIATIPANNSKLKDFLLNRLLLTSTEEPLIITVDNRPIPAFVTRFLKEGSFINEYRLDNLNEAFYIFNQLNVIFEFLLKNNIYLTDYLHNIFITSQNTVQLFDLGLTAILDTNDILIHPPITSMGSLNTFNILLAGVTGEGRDLNYFIKINELAPMFTILNILGIKNYYGFTGFDLSEPVYPQAVTKIYGDLHQLLDASISENPKITANEILEQISFPFITKEVFIDYINTRFNGPKEKAEELYDSFDIDNLNFAFREYIVKPMLISKGIQI